MDAITAINVLTALVFAGMGWWMNDLWQAHKSLRQEVSEFKQSIPEKYVSKIDFKDDLDEIKQTLRDIAREIRGRHHIEDTRT
jgi:hypothetical protein